jgi:hypothetical protein
MSQTVCLPTPCRLGDGDQTGNSAEIFLGLGLAGAGHSYTLSYSVFSIPQKTVSEKGFCQPLRR